MLYDIYSAAAAVARRKTSQLCVAVAVEIVSHAAQLHHVAESKHIVASIKLSVYDDVVCCVVVVAVVVVFVVDVEVLHLPCSVVCVALALVAT